MNLHKIVSGAISAVNPQTLVMWRISSGHNIAPDGTQTPNYITVPNVPVQVQALSYSDLMKMGALNVQGTRRKIYMNGNPEGLDRNAIKGGDLVDMPNLPNFPGPTTWLVTQVLEHWPDWASIAITLQNRG
jgi:hypothetical protein